MRSCEATGGPCAPTRGRERERGRESDSGRRELVEAEADGRGGWGVGWDEGCELEGGSWKGRSSNSKASLMRARP